MMPIDVRVLGDAAAFGRSLRNDLDNARTLSVAVAFAKESALDVVDMERWCDDGRQLRLLAGTDFAITELELIKRLGKRAHAECRIYHSVTRARSFHPKLYVLDKGDSKIAYVGSSNFTRGGLVGNIEANVRLEGSADAPELRNAQSLFDSLFGGEYSTPISEEFESKYSAMQRAMRAMQTYPNIVEQRGQLRLAENLLVGAYRAQVSNTRWLLVTSPHNFSVCIANGVWGRQSEREIGRYKRGDVFFFHVTGGRGLTAFGMFTDDPYHEDSPLWEPDRRGNFPWRIRLHVLTLLATRSVNTKAVLTPLRKDAPSHWFHGFIQQSHSLVPADFDALKRAFDREACVENGVEW